jgi:hypothetical protein
MILFITTAVKTSNPTYWNEGQVTSEESCYSAEFFICEVLYEFNKKKGGIL